MDRIVITGHHQGAIVGVLLAYHLISEQAFDPQRISVFGFGAPHLVSKKLVGYINRKSQVTFV